MRPPDAEPAVVSVRGAGLGIFRIQQGLRARVGSVSESKGLVMTRVIYAAIRPADARRKRRREPSAVQIAGTVRGAWRHGTCSLLFAVAAYPAWASEPLPPGGVRPPLVTCVRARQTVMVETVSVTGTLLPREEVVATSEIVGSEIVEVLAEEGDAVTRGQVLVRLSRSVLEAQIQQITAAIAVATAAIGQANSQIAQQKAVLSQSTPALERARALFRSGTAPAALLEQRQADQRADEAKLAAAQQGLAVAEAEKRLKEAQRNELWVRLDRTEIRAPVDGVVVGRTARLGAVTEAVQDALFRIAQDSRIELEAEIPESALSKIGPGQVAAVTIGEGQVIEGRVRVVRPEVDKASRLGKARIAFSHDPRLHVGGFAQGTMETARRRSVAVPMAAVLYEPDGTALQTVANDRIVINKVQTGLRMGNLVEIVSGVTEGAVVVASAGPFFGAGDPVTPVMVGPEESR